MWFWKIMSRDGEAHAGCFKLYLAASWQGVVTCKEENMDAGLHALACMWLPIFCFQTTTVAATNFRSQMSFILDRFHCLGRYFPCYGRRKCHIVIKLACGLLRLVPCVCVCLLYIYMPSLFMIRYISVCYRLNKGFYIIFPHITW